MLKEEKVAQRQARRKVLAAKSAGETAAAIENEVRRVREDAIEAIQALEVILYIFHRLLTYE